MPLLELGFYLFAAIEKPLDRTAFGLFVVPVEHVLNSAHGDVQRNAALLPSVDQCPVYRRKKQILPAPTYECFFDLGVVIERSEERRVGKECRCRWRLC